jgi:hypothetical protein
LASIKEEIKQEGVSLNIMRQGANILVMWTTSDEDDTEKAKQAYLSFTKQGWLATTRTCEHEFQRILRFTPQAGEMLFIPFSEGG